MTATVTSLYRYPIKGLSPQAMSEAAIRSGQPIAADRIWAFARPGTPIDLARPLWAKKGMFIMLMLEASLATIGIDLDVDAARLHVRHGDTVLSFDLTRANDRSRVESLVHELVPGLPHAPPLLRSADGHFMDKPDNVISLMNLATVRSLGDRWRRDIDPMRFRANIYIDGLAPWSEFDLVGQDISIGGVPFRVDRRNGRCGATNVNPATGDRDLDIPRGLRADFGHKDLGVYLLARGDGAIRAGDRISVQDPNSSATAPESTSPFAQGGYICGGCYFMYDEAKGSPAHGIPPETRFDDIPDRWTCPDCGSGKQTFKLNADRPTEA